MNKERKYTYSGPVLQFGKCICNKWEGSTYAVSEAKAKSNLAYRFKQEFGKDRNYKIELPNKCIVSEVY